MKRTFFEARIFLTIIVAVVTGWVIGGIGTTNLNAAEDITPPSEPISHTITASAGANGSISPSGSVSVLGGANQKFTCTPQIGYRVADVVIDGTSRGAWKSYTFYRVAGDHSISVSFVLDVYTINVAVALGGSVVVSGTSITPIAVNGGDSTIFTVNSGDSLTLTVTPELDRKVVSVIDNGAAKYRVTTYSLTNIRKDHTMRVYFK